MEKLTGLREWIATGGAEGPLYGVARLEIPERFRWNPCSSAEPSCKALEITGRISYVDRKLGIITVSV